MGCTKSKEQKERDFVNDYLEGQFKWLAMEFAKHMAHRMSSSPYSHIDINDIHDFFTEYRGAITPTLVNYIKKRTP